jgi:cytochrome P450
MLYRWANNLIGFDEHNKDGIDKDLELYSILDGDRNFLIPLAIEETLRYRSPVQAVFSVAIRDVNIGGQTIHSGKGLSCG